MIVPAPIRFKGTYDIVLRDTITGKIKDKRKIDNMLLNGLIRFLLGDLRSLRDASYTFIIGTDNTPPSRSDTGIKGTALDSQSNTLSTSGQHPFILTRTVTFQKGSGTGSIGEIVLQTEGSNSRAISRIALDPKIEKTDTDELIVTYTLTAYRSADVISGTIPGGQRDGVTDINWKLTINNRQFYQILYRGLNDIISLRLGDSNADSNLINDSHDAIKGNEIARFSPIHYWLEYSPENNYRDLMFEFNKNQGKGNIAELVILRSGDFIPGQPQERFGLCRVTFDPPLDNTDPDYRLFLTFRFYIDLGEETDVTIKDR